MALWSFQIVFLGHPFTWGHKRSPQDTQHIVAMQDLIQVHDKSLGLPPHCSQSNGSAWSRPEQRKWRRAALPLDVKKPFGVMEREPFVRAPIMWKLCHLGQQRWGEGAATLPLPHTDQQERTRGTNSLQNFDQTTTVKPFQSLRCMVWNDSPGVFWSKRACTSPQRLCSINILNILSKIFLLSVLSLKMMLTWKSIKWTVIKIRLQCFNPCVLSIHFCSKLFRQSTHFTYHLSIPDMSLILIILLNSYNNQLT